MSAFGHSETMTCQDAIFLPDGAVEETLCITLAARAVDARSSSPLLADPVAGKLVGAIDANWAGLKRSFGLSGICLRARVIDALVRGFLSQHPEGTIVELGCGLDARFERTDNGRATWWELDVPTVIDVRRQFFHETPRRRFLSGSAFDADWLDIVAASNPTACLIVAEGSTIYFPLKDNLQLLSRIAARLPGAGYVTDAAGRLFVATQRWHPQIGRFTARIPWSLPELLRAIRNQPDLSIDQVIDPLAPPKTLGLPPLPLRWRLARAGLSLLGPLGRGQYRVLHLTLGNRVLPSAE